MKRRRQNQRQRGEDMEPHDTIGAVRGAGPSADSADEERDRLARELAEALEHQAATSEVLSIISRSPTDAQPVFDMIAKSAARLCGAQFCHIFRFDGELIHFVAHHGLPPERVETLRRTYPIPPGRRSATARAILNRDIEQIADVQADPDYERERVADIALIRSFLSVPMLKDGSPVGAITLARTQTGNFPARQIELLKTFADQAAIAIQNASLLNELRESLQQQTATADVLKIISRATFDLPTVLDALLRSAGSLCEADMGAVLRPQDERFIFAASFGFPQAFVDLVKDLPIEAGRETLSGRVMAELRAVHIPDVQADPEYLFTEAQKAAGFRTMLGLPLLREGIPIGIILLMRSHVRPFTDKQIDLVQTFADQAVIAIENMRLFEAEQQRMRELSEALDRQTATAEVLNVISRSTAQLQPVLDTIVQTASRLCKAEIALVFMLREKKLCVVATNNASNAFVQHAIDHPLPLGRGSCSGRSVLERQVIHIPDCLADAEYTVLDYQAVGKYRSMLGVPLLSDGAPIGVITLVRTAVMPFTEKQIDLVKTFADQAVIAIENVRLFEAEQERTRELTESLQQQTATADVLKVISRSTFDLQTVLDTLVELATRLCNADYTWLFQREGEYFRWVAGFGLATDVHARMRDLMATNQVPVNRGSITGRVALEARAIHVPDVLADPEYTLSLALETQKIGGYRAALGVPLLRQGEVVGVIFIAKTVPQPFTAKQIELATTFADQAVIAIENTRVLNELRESLQQQTATAEVLQVINSSPGALAPVFEAMLEKAMHLCNAAFGAMYMFEADRFVAVALRGVPDRYAAHLAKSTVIPGPGTAPYRMLRGERVIHNIDLASEEPYRAGDLQRRALVDLGGARTALQVALHKEDAVLGLITIYRQEVRPFSDKQISLVQNFAAQAVIAIENTRLLNELRESLQQQTATADVLKIISSSPGELQPVFAAMLAKATDLCTASYGAMWLREQDGYRAVAIHGDLPQDYIQQLRNVQIYRPGSDVPLRRAIEARHPVQILDMRESASYLARDPLPVSAVEIAGVRTLVAVPMLKDNEPIGAIAIYRKEVRSFTDKQIELATTFADQAVIAIENTRLLNELRDSLQQQTATADVLKVISRSTFDLHVVLDTLVKSAVQLCEADIGHIARPSEAGYFQTQAHFGFSPELKEELERVPFKPSVAPPQTDKSCIIFST